MNEDGTLNVENITGWEYVSQAERDLLAQQLLTAVHKTTAPAVGPVHPTDLAALLARIPSDRERQTTTHYPSPSRSSTAEAPEDATQAYETNCYQALLDHGCRPLFHISLLARVEANPDAYRDLLRPWTRYPEDWQVFSRQRDRWKQLRTWQLHNGRRTVSFSEYLAEQRRELVISGGTSKWAARPDFEQAARRLWEREYDYGQPQLDGDDDGLEAVFSRYSEYARRLLIDHGFLQPFQLLADPKQQDQRTTYVEYLAFEYSTLGRLVMVTQKLQNQLPNYAQKYQTAKAEADHQQRRVDWVRSEISKIEAEQKTAGKSSSSSDKTRSRKRKLTDDANSVDLVESRFGSRRRPHETEKVAGTSGDSRTTRSKKRKLPVDEDALKLVLERKDVAGKGDAPGTRSGKRRKGYTTKIGVQLQAVSCNRISGRR
ncbi:MAG: hypothetical protein Q9196_005084 [Gyalolechia fulgens]